MLSEHSITSSFAVFKRRGHLWKKLALIFLLLPITVLFANEYHGCHRNQLADISNVVEQDKYELYLIHDAYMKGKNRSHGFSAQKMAAALTNRKTPDIPVYNMTSLQLFSIRISIVRWLRSWGATAGDKKPRRKIPKEYIQDYRIARRADR